MIPMYGTRIFRVARLEPQKNFVIFKRNLLYGLTVSFYFITQQRYLKLKFISGPVRATRPEIHVPGRRVSGQSGETGTLYLIQSTLVTKPQKI